MGAPRRRVTKTRSAEKRGAHWKFKPSQLVPCPQCGTLRLPHTRCQKCGNYKGKEVVI